MKNYTNLIPTCYTSLNKEIFDTINEYIKTHSLSPSLILLAITDLIDKRSDDPQALFFMRDEQGNTLLHSACLYNKEEIALLLISKCAHPKEQLFLIPNKVGHTPLILACNAYSHKILALMLEEASYPQSLLVVQNHKKQTLLHIAAWNNDEKIISLILNLNVDTVSVFSIQDTYGFTPLVYLLSKPNGLLLIENILEKIYPIQSSANTQLLHSIYKFSTPNSLKKVCSKFGKLQNLLSAQCNQGKTILHFAMIQTNLLEMHSSLSLINLILKYAFGKLALLNIQDYSGLKAQDYLNPGVREEVNTILDSYHLLEKPSPSKSTTERGRF